MAALLALINFKRLFHRNIFMDDGANGLNHPHGRVRLENIAAHVDADGAVADGIVSELESFHLGRLLATGDDHRDGAAADKLVEIVAVVSLDDMRAHFRGDSAGQK